MKQNKKKILVKTMAGLCTVAVLSTSFGIYDVHAEKLAEENKKMEQETDVLSTVLEQQIVTKNASETGKEETVYVLSDANGKVKDVIVSEWLKNPKQEMTLSDATTLNDIVNLKGDETFTKEDGDKITWQTQGNDIYYQGTTTKELPVDITVTYYLDGKEMKPEEIAGKNGKVTIRLDYSNKESKKIDINGEEQEIYIPFTVISGMILPGEHFTNIEATNAKVIQEGNNSIVVGLAFPGLKDSLKLSDEDFEKAELDVPEYVEITADATDFTLDMTMSLVLSDVLSDVNLNTDIDFSEVTDSMDTLSEASSKLVDGTGQMKDGATELADKSKEFQTGVDRLKDGITEYTDGVGSVGEGAEKLKGGTEELKNGASKLKSGATELKNGASALKSGASELKNGAGSLANGAANAVAGINKLKTGAQTLDDGMEQFNASLNTYCDGTVEILKNTKALLLQQINTQLQATGIPVTITSTEELAQLIAQLSGSAPGTTAFTPYSAPISALEEVPENEESPQEEETPVAEENPQTQEPAPEAETPEEETNDKKEAATSTPADDIPQTTENRSTESILASLQNAYKLLLGIDSILNNTESLKAASAALNNGIGDLNNGLGSLQSGLNTLNDGAAKLAKGAAALETGTINLENGTITLENGTVSLESGAITLDNGMETLVGGVAQLTGSSAQLTNGAASLADGTGQLLDGIEQLKEGAVDLDEGMMQFDEEGIQKITDAFEGTGDLEALLDRIEAITEAGHGYHTFTALPENTEGSVKFIVKTGAVKQ